MSLSFPTHVNGKVYSIPIPVDADGNGPVTDGSHVFIWYEVWDQVCQSICRCGSEADAKLIARLINYDNQEFGN